MSLSRQRPNQPAFNVSSVVLTVLLCVLSLPMMGCIGASAQLMNMIYGPEHPAKVGDLKEKRVAILVAADVTSFSSRSVDQTLERKIAKNLIVRGEKISVVPIREVDRWRDNHPSDTNNLQSLGEAVNADYVLHLRVENYDIRLGKTLYKGHCDYQIDLHDVKENKLAYYDTREQHEFPKNSGRPTIETTASQFQSAYLSVLADEISRNFYPNDPNETVAIDSVQR